jgi:hypothetical protein
MAPAVPLPVGAPRQPEVRLVHKRGRLERVPRLLAREARRRKRTQFVVHERQKLLRSRRVAGVNGVQDPGDFTGVRFRLTIRRGHESWVFASFNAG